ncbi:MAG: ATP-binding cassette domain-containing protein [Fidelibacterota bacterium]
MLIVEHLKKSYHLGPVLNDITFTVGSGITVGVLGKNGAGKTTLLRVIARITSCDGGEVKLHDKSVLKGPASERAGILYLGHQPNLYPVLTGEENLRLVARLYGCDVSGEDILNTLDHVDLLRQRWDPIRYYSRGMLQRLGLAKAVMVPWEILLMDEPASGLDEVGVGLLESFIRRWQEEHRSMIVVSHDRAWLQTYCSHILELKDGVMSEISSA